MTIRVYRDVTANSVVFVPCTVPAKFINSLHAVVSDERLVDIYDVHVTSALNPLFEMKGIPHAEILDRDGNPAGATVAATVNYLNSQFEGSGGTGGIPPTITSSLTASVESGFPFFYVITATETPSLCPGFL